MKVTVEMETEVSGTKIRRLASIEQSEGMQDEELETRLELLWRKLRCEHLRLRKEANQ